LSQVEPVRVFLETDWPSAFEKETDNGTYSAQFCVGDDVNFAAVCFVFKTDGFYICLTNLLRSGYEHFFRKQSAPLFVVTNMIMEHAKRA